MDPLTQLKDIHLPEQVHNYPVSLGWWLLAVILLLIIITSIVKLRRYTKRNKAKKQALKQLTTAMEPQAIVMLMKWAILQYFPREQVAELSGNKFKAFLIEQLPTNHQQEFDQRLADSLSLVYQSNSHVIDTENFQYAAKLWLNQALPPRPLQQVSNKDER